MNVIIGSKNPVKIEAVDQAFRLIWPEREFKFTTTSVDSGVSDQPMSEKESITGAVNRAKNAIRSEQDADFGVGLERGI